MLDTSTVTSRTTRVYLVGRELWVEMTEVEEWIRGQTNVP